MKLLVCVLLFCFGLNNGAKLLPDIPVQDVFEYWLEIRDQMSMINYERDHTHPDVLVFDVEKQMYRIRDRDQTKACDAFLFRNATDADFAKVVFADGLHRPMISVNGTLPGPTLMATQGSEVVVHVTNRLFFDSLTVHWHGITMRGNFWNDGAAGVSQFPIVPGQTFTYRFSAEDAGTFFYHGHYGTDRGDGLNGAFIIIPAESPPMNQYVMNLADWFPRTARENFLKNHWHLHKYPFGFDNMERCYILTRSFDGSKVGSFPFHALLINGKGWWNLWDILRRPRNLPLETFPVRSQERYLFRVLNFGMVYPIILAIEGHKLTVISTDGSPIKPIQADYLVINPGERFDFTLQTLEAPAKSNYYIFLRTNEFYDGHFNPIWFSQTHAGLGFLQYEQAKDPSTFQPPNFDMTTRCRPGCVVANCPFPHLGPLPNARCITLDQMRSVTAPEDQSVLEAESENLVESFLGIFFDTKISGFSFVYPKTPPALSSEETDVLVPCTESCRNSICSCTQVLHVPLNSTVQLIFANTGRKERSTTVEGYTHPMHLHGHRFYVTKIGFPSYTRNGSIEDISRDVTCVNGYSECSWTERGWSAGQIPGQNLVDPPLKDTVAVPSGGYAVVRFRADNPGWWPIHCHTLSHHLNGMALLLKTGDKEQLPTRPDTVTQSKLGDVELRFQVLTPEAQLELRNETEVGVISSVFARLSKLFAIFKY